MTQIATASTEMTALANSIRAHSGPNVHSTFQNVQQTIASRSHDSANDLERTKRRLDSIVYNNWYGLGGWRSTLERWNELWLTKSVAEYQLASLSVEELRAGVQPTYADLKAARDREAEKLAQMEQVLAAHREAASLKWKAAFFRALRALATILFFVWFLGVLVEGAGLAVRMADDVRRMREAAAPEAVAAAPAPEVRLPIREEGAAHVRTVSPMS